MFDRLPLSAVIDHEIFCCHGGIPRPIDGYQNELEAILDMPNVASVMPAYDHEEPWMKQASYFMFASLQSFVGRKAAISLSFNTKIVFCPYVAYDTFILGRC